MNLPDPSAVTDLIDAFRRSKTMFTAVSLAVFDTLAEGPSDPATLAHRLKLNPWRAGTAPGRLRRARVSIEERPQGSWGGTSIAAGGSGRP
jgi:acetylserotonin N-methyltransferase